MKVNKVKVSADSDGRDSGLEPWDSGLEPWDCARVCRGVPRVVCVRAPEGLRGR